MPKRTNRYQGILEKVFFDHYAPGVTEFTWRREEMVHAANELGIRLPKNLGDVIYSIRFRTPLPKSVLATEPPRRQWIILLAGRSVYKFKLVSLARLAPRTGMAISSIPDSTPELLKMYSMNDEQALLAILRYGRVLDTFLQLTTFSLQSHLRTTVTGIGQIEVDEVYVGIDKEGGHYVIPVQAKGGNDELSVVQTIQDLAWAAAKFPSMRCRAISAQFIEPKVIALFELSGRGDELQIVEEKHYRICEAAEIDHASTQRFVPL